MEVDKPDKSGDPDAMTGVDTTHHDAHQNIQQLPNLAEDFYPTEPVNFFGQTHNKNPADNSTDPRPPMPSPFFVLNANDIRLNPPSWSTDRRSLKPLLPAGTVPDGCRLDGFDKRFPHDGLSGDTNIPFFRSPAREDKSLEDPGRMLPDTSPTDVPVLADRNSAEFLTGTQPNYESGSTVLDNNTPPSTPWPWASPPSSPEASKIPEPAKRKKLVPKPRRQRPTP